MSHSGRAGGDGPRVRVVTPVMNGGPFLAEAMESVRAQTHANWDYVVLDNCSDDATPEVARQIAAADPRITVLRNDERLPIIANWNRAIAAVADGADYVKVLHADDWLHPDCLARMVEVAGRDPAITVVSSLVAEGARVGGTGLPPDREVFDGDEVCRATLLDELYVFGGPSALLLRGDAVRHRLPHFYDPLYLHADFEVGYALLRGHRLGFVHSALTGRRLHEGSVSETFAGRFNSNAVDQIGMFDRHGPALLGPERHAELRARHWRDYRRMVARRSLAGRGRPYWRYHVRRMGELGYRLDWRDFAAGLALEAAAWIADPRAAAAMVRRQFSRAPAPAASAVARPAAGRAPDGRSAAPR